MKNLVIGAAAVVCAFAASGASATNYSFTKSGTNTWVQDGLTLTVTGWATSRTGTNPLPFEGTATPYVDNGYGVRNASTDTSHTIDNLGSYDFLRLEFSKAVALTGVSLKAFGGTDSWISYGEIGATAMGTSAGWTSLLGNGQNFLGSTLDRSFDPAIRTRSGALAQSSVWLIGAGRVADSDDSFKISAITVAPVPEPATWAMMILGAGAAGVAMRRRSRVHTTVSHA